MIPGRPRRRIAPHDSAAAPRRFPTAWLGAALAVLFAAAATAGQPPRQLRVVSAGGTRTVPVHRVAGDEMVPLDELAAAVGGVLGPGGGERQVAVRLGGRVVRFDAGRSFVLVDRSTRVLRNPSLRRGGRWFVPLDFVARVLPDVLAGSRYDDRERVLAVAGEYPELEVEILPQPNATRVRLRTAPETPLHLEETPGQVTVVIGAPFLETDFLSEAPRDGVVDRVDLRRTGTGYRLRIRTGRNFGRIRQQRAPGQFDLDFLRAGTAVSSSGEILRARPEGSDLAARPTRRSELRTIAIDPGHGGPDFGATGSRGVSEKDVALAVARALRDRLVEEYGFDLADVILTRSDDRQVSLDDRTVAANAAGADLLLSIHLNASPSAGASGSVVYYLTPGAAARGRGAAARFVPWDQAQYEYLAASRALAEQIAIGLAALSLPSEGVAHAPLRVLSGAAMPAVQVELGYVTSPRDRERLRDPAFHEEAARALAAGIVRYRADAIRATGPGE